MNISLGGLWGNGPVGASETKLTEIYNKRHSSLSFTVLEDAAVPFLVTVKESHGKRTTKKQALHPILHENQDKLEALIVNVEKQR